ncbi:GNAT family acetyltransferase [Candidatus Nitrosoglobus terrae]|uniref:GNAT family acetyltransferase n=1 Tax=Candidatus Nitrosoglobus terrae TaxID=1630141 RepID=A0A1Q2SPD2_9GAMM|nr:GNAT family N-acetyltransferase/peptidase C39 family protein [Candidatus Nitrosoglobus terrae]BAW80949.1 GNAT family acetyltransferase [Candidatus Nitrosoglobus terrae]
MVRLATISDLDALVDLEASCFHSDRLSRRNFRYMLTRANGSILVEEDDHTVRGYVLLLFSRGTAMARLYSIAVGSLARKQGVGEVLVKAAEVAARERGAACLRLEIRKDNRASLSLFNRLGYKKFGEFASYYEDHMDALRLEKTLTPDLNLDLLRVPFYEQTLDFTCGPSALMMAMKALHPELTLNRKLELRIWREATTIFMTSGHGGCGPYGLALSAWHRGFGVEIYVKAEETFLLNSVRSAEKKEVVRLVQEDMIEEIHSLDIPIIQGSLTVPEIREKFEKGSIPVIFISSYRIYGEKFPHWVVVVGFDDHFVYVHDPYVDYENEETPTDSISMPILHWEFGCMARYGRAGLAAVLMISRREG